MRTPLHAAPPNYPPRLTLNWAHHTVHFPITTAAPATRRHARIRGHGLSPLISLRGPSPPHHIPFGFHRSTTSDQLHIPALTLRIPTSAPPHTAQRKIGAHGTPSAHTISIRPRPVTSHCTQLSTPPSSLPSVLLHHAARFLRRPAHLRPSRKPAHRLRRSALIPATALPKHPRIPNFPEIDPNPGDIGLQHTVNTLVRARPD